jgi:hypothetical protein
MNTVRAPGPGRWLAAVAVVLVVSILSLRSYRLPLPEPLTVDLVLGRAEAGRTEPVITAGRTGAGDFLFVRHLDGERVSFGYEPWGGPATLSSPVPLPADRRLRLRIEMPALNPYRAALAPPAGRLRLIANGAGVFDTEVRCHPRALAEIWFAENPIGGTTCEAGLTGHLLLADGRELRGDPAILLTSGARLVSWLTVAKWPALGALLLGAATFWVWGRWERWTAPGEPGGGAAPTRGRALARLVWRHRWFAGTAATGTIAFAGTISFGTFQLWQRDTFAEFFDYQAVSLLQGRLDVPGEAIGGEAFVFDGKNYGYFGLTPALLRVPFVIYDVGLGRLTRVFMVAYFAGTLLAAYLLLRAVKSILGYGDEPPSPWATLSFIGAIGLGSTLPYLGSLAYVYHEAILGGVVFAVWACWCALRHYAAPEGRWWLGSLVCGVLSVHARPPTGLFALCFLAAVGVVVVIQRRRDRTSPLRRQGAIAVLCGVGVLSFSGVSYLKFRTFEGCPLRYNVQYDAARLARIDGKQFHLANLGINLEHYLFGPNFRLEPRFPYFFLIRGLRYDEWLGSKIDYHEPTLGVPYAMPALFALATLGGLAAWRRYPAQRLLIAGTWVAGMPMSLAMLTAIAFTHRYTADFCPLLITAAAFGTAGLEPGTGRRRVVARTAVAFAVLGSVLITSAITLHYQGKEVWGVPGEARARYQNLCDRIDAAVASLRG